MPYGWKYTFWLCGPGSIHSVVKPFYRRWGYILALPMPVRPSVAQTYMVADWAIS